MIDNVADNYLDYLVHHIYENLKVFIRLNPTINTTLTIRLPDALGTNGQIIKEWIMNNIEKYNGGNDNEWYSNYFW